MAHKTDARSWLFVPGDSERKLAKAVGAGADAVIVDLEDAVGQEHKPRARKLAREWLAAQPVKAAEAPRAQHWVRINPLGSPWWREDLAAVMPAAPHGIMLPKASGPAQLELLGAELTELEERFGLPHSATRIMPLVSETPAAALALPAYAGSTLPRLAALSWGAEDLAAAIGATRKRDPSGQWTDLFRMVRATMLLAAHAAGVPAIDTLHGDFTDLEALDRIARAARADGFGGMLAIHPAQVPVINAAFTASDEELRDARAIVAAFARNPGSGALALDGRLIELPHLDQAKRLLGLQI
ncbi:MAG: CoA ester lyase [Candidatus Andeanibacterium colombiense]|uniref:CoA ester lyase n=1 Tax=Candidatus Andeanibacterium colombiense TaxID=3121345 RepID=A0AAJ5XB18_9SPHN|nr:MAG: CoA ester lyase [Sphingomonadaceae bacterium]